MLFSFKKNSSFTLIFLIFNFHSPFDFLGDALVFYQLRPVLSTDVLKFSLEINCRGFTTVIENLLFRLIIGSTLFSDNTVGLIRLFHNTISKYFCQLLECCGFFPLVGLVKLVFFLSHTKIQIQDKVII